MTSVALADPFTTALAAGLVVVLIGAGFLGWACYRLLVDRGRLLLRLPDPETENAQQLPDGLRAGAFLSDFALPALDGGVATLSGLVDRPLLLVFVQPNCLFSRAVAREMAAHAPVADAPLPVLIVCGEATGRDDLVVFAGHRGPVLLDLNGQVARLTRVPITPAGYFIDENRRTVGSLLVGPLALIAAMGGDPLTEPAGLPHAITPILGESASELVPLASGAAAPGFTLPTATGGEWSLQAHLGRPLTLVFSDPGCPPCASLLTELGRQDAAGVVLISRGAAAENRQLVEATRLTAPMLLQRNREVARAYRTLETPAAFIINEAGTIAAGPAIGTEEVLALVAKNGMDKVNVTGETGVAAR